MMKSPKMSGDTKNNVFSSYYLMLTLLAAVLKRKLYSQFGNLDILMTIASPYFHCSEAGAIEPMTGLSGIEKRTIYNIPDSRGI